MKGGGVSLCNIPNVHPINDLQEVSTRHANALTVTPTAPVTIGASLADIPLLVAEIRSLRFVLAIERLARANMVAAATATLTADADGDTDPFWFLWDELAAQARLDAGREVRLW